MRTYNDSMFIDTFEHEYTWLSGFLRNVHRFPMLTALVDPETNRFWTYKTLNEEANALANALKKEGIKKNDVVMVVTRNCPEFAFAYTGIRKIGAIMLAANSNLASGELALLINHNKPEAVIYSANIEHTIKDAEQLCKFKPGKFILADNLEKNRIPENHISYEDFVKKQSKETPEINFRPHIYDEVLRLCTSGTTALPKSVPINDINEVLSAHDVIMHYPMNHNDVTLNMTPWFHRGGCHSGGLCPTFYAGACAVVMRKFLPSTSLEWVEKYKITYMMGSPSNLAMLCRSQEKSPKNLSTLKGLVTMGAPLSKADCIRYMQVLTPNIFNGYGTTETFWNSFLRPYNLPDGAGSVGSSCTDDEVRVVKIYEGKKAEPDDCVPFDNKTEGEIIIHSPAKTTYSYINNDEMMNEKFYKGWMYTGDTGIWNSDLIVTVRGRKDDLIITSGENLYPAQIEEAINEHPKVRDCIITSVPDKVRGQAVAAYIVPDDKSLTVQELFEFCTKHKMLSMYKRPRYFAIVDELPLTATGKKKHFEMKNRAVNDLKNGVLKKD
ncbi:class I adenylate-forming enzyme family protein [Treponema sp.]|uniref:class I adenylate-forming enzyme family protein n=1 Tax=Treponema sp. TaxID=166 RepID=UPI00388F82C8